MSEHPPSPPSKTPPPPSKSPVPSKSRPQLVRPPLAVGSGGIGRLASIRSPHDRRTPLAPVPEFTPLIPSASKLRKPSSSVAADAIDRKLPGPLSHLMAERRNPDAPGSSGRGRRSAVGGRTRTFHPQPSTASSAAAAAPTVGLAPPGAGGVQLHGAGASHVSAIAKAQIEAELARTPAPEEAERPAEPDFDAWSCDEPVELPLRDPRDAVDPLTLPPFLDAAGQMLYDELFLLQMPSSLPLAPKQQPTAAAAASTPAQQQQEIAASAAQEVYEKQHEFETPPFRGNLGGMDGYMGRLLFRKSGRVTLRLTNGVEFDLQPGSTPRFLEEFFLISVKSQTCYRLGPVARHVCVLPNTANIGIATQSEAAEAAYADTTPAPSASPAASSTVVQQHQTQSPPRSPSQSPPQLAVDDDTVLVPMEGISEQQPSKTAQPESMEVSDEDEEPKK